MFQEIEPYEFCNDFAWVDPEPTDRVLIYRGSSVLVAGAESVQTAALEAGATAKTWPDAEIDKRESPLRFPSYQLLRDAGVVGPKVAQRGLAKADGTHPEAFFLFTVGETAYFHCAVDEEALERLLAGSAGNMSDESMDLSMGDSLDDLTGDSKGVLSGELSTELTGGSQGVQVTGDQVDDGQVDGGQADDSLDALHWRFMPISMLHFHQPRHRVFAGMVGYEYAAWYDQRRFCGRCGSRMVHDEVERMVRCPECNTMEFSKLFPAVIIGIVDPVTDRVLVSRYANREYKRYALVAGFCEMGETVEQTVHREVMEEVGLSVKNLRYYKSQPWPPSSSLLFGFFCELDGDARITLDEHELEHAEWLPREELPKEESDYSLTREMMRVLREGREKDYGPRLS